MQSHLPEAVGVARAKFERRLDLRERTLVRQHGHEPPCLGREQPQSSPGIVVRTAHAVEGGLLAPQHVKCELNMILTRYARSDPPPPFPHPIMPLIDPA